MKEQLTTCRKCGSPLCYERHNDTLISWDCLQCGFTTNTLFIDNTEAVLSYESMLPSLFRDIKFIDSDSFVWYPSTVTKEGVGIIFPDGSSKEDWNGFKVTISKSLILMLVGVLLIPLATV